MYAKYIDSMGGDLAVVNAARNSFGVAHQELTEKDVRLLWFLARGRTQAEHHALLQEVIAASSAEDAEAVLESAKVPTHWVPFAHVKIMVQISAPIFVRAQWGKTWVDVARTADVPVSSELSRRYVTDDPEHWVPDTVRTAPGEDKKQGSGGRHHESDWHRQVLNNSQTISTARYTGMIDAGVAPEQARAVLPQGAYTTWTETASLYAYAQLCRQRLAPDAQDEVGQLAAQVDDICASVAPHAWAAIMNRRQ